MPDDHFVCRCVLCHDYGDGDSADRVDLKVSEDIRRFGWHVVMVPEDGTGRALPMTRA
jgi:hypothetical protein